MKVFTNEILQICMAHLLEHNLFYKIRKINQFFSFYKFWSPWTPGEKSVLRYRKDIDSAYSHGTSQFECPYMRRFSEDSRRKQTGCKA